MTRETILIVLVIFAIVGGGIYWWFLPPAPDELAEGFAPHIDAYLEQTKLIVDQQGHSIIPGPPLGVKTVAIDVRKRTLDAIHAILPDQFHAPNKPIWGISIETANEPPGDAGGPIDLNNINE